MWPLATGGGAVGQNPTTPAELATEEELGDA
jgi:hypothetical protein